MNNIMQIPSSDGCVYIYNLDSGKAQKVCDVGSPRDFPEDVKDRIAGLQRMTVGLKWEGV